PKPASRAMAVTTDGRVAVGTEDTVVLFAPDGAAGRELAAPGQPSALTFSADGSRLAAANLDGSVLVFDVATGAAANRLRAETNAVAAAFPPTGDTLVVGTTRSVCVFDLWIGERTRRFATGVTTLTMAPDGGLLATADFDGRVRLWDWRTGTAVR